METPVIETEAEDTVLRKLDYQGASGAVGESFGWKPDPFARAAIAVLSRFMRPLEQGSYEGRTLSGEPHRASWVIASPLNVFVVHGGSYWRKIVLASRLRHTGFINVVSTGRDPGRAGEVLRKVIGLQRECDVALRLVPVARASHQVAPSPADVSIAAKAYRLAPHNLLRRATSRLRTLRTGRVKNCRPIALPEWLRSRNGDGDEELAAALRLELMGNIESQHRACQGPGEVPVWEVKRRVLSDPLLASYMQEYGLGQGISADEVAAEARGYIDEIASDYRVGVVRWFARAVDFLFDRFLSGIEVDRAGISFLQECESSSRLVLVCSHKSYIDPLLIGYSLFRSGMVPPCQAAGLNLDFWPVGWLLRHSGAFYLRRTFTGETLYREVFGAYVRYLLARNHIMVVYIEGTRSRDGKLARPRTGFMSILEQSLDMGICRDIKLVPVYLGYDRTPEEGAHVREMAGGRKVAESVSGLSRMLRSVNTRLGRAFVKFGEPLSMRSLLEERGLEGACEAACDGINRVTPITARGIAASAILASGIDSVTDERLELSVRTFLDYALERGKPLAPGADPEGVAAAVEAFCREGRISRTGEDTGEWRIDPVGRRYLEYNKNLVINHFLDASIEAAGRQGCTGDAVGDGHDHGEAAAFLRDLLSEEFVFGPAACPGGETAGMNAPGLFGGLLGSFVEGYAVTARALRESTGAPVHRDDAMELCLSGGERMLEDGEIARPEAVSKTICANAIRKYVAIGAIEERREKTRGARDVVSYAGGPRFDMLAEIEARLLGLAGGGAPARGLEFPVP